MVSFDEALKAIEDQLYDAESILSDARHAIAAYMEEVSFDEEQLAETEKRLDLIHNLQAKYGATIEQIFVSLEEKKTRLDQLANFDEYRRETQREYEKAREQLEILCGQLSELRRKAAVSLTARIRDGLIDLNFLDVRFDMEFRISIPGAFNVENALAAVAVLYDYPIDAEHIYNGLYKAHPSGRMELYATEDKKVIAYLRAFYQENDGDIVRIGRVLTLQHGNGTGRDLLEQSLKVIKENMKCKKIVMDAQKYAVGFYEKFGFKTISDDFYEEGILHVVMELDV